MLAQAGNGARDKPPRRLLPLCAMSEPDDTPQPADGPLPTSLGGLNPGELLARGLHTAKMSSAGAHGWEPPSVAEAAALFPSYEVLAMLGRGGMGAVFKARQIALDRFVAIKLLPLEISVDPAFVDRFRREARAMAKLNHPHIISVFDFGQTAEGHLFFVMEFVEGANLAEIIHQVGLAPDQALALAGQVCTALAYAHGKGVVHRDIKPANVMVDAESQVKVADFGLARLTDPTAETYGTTVTGTVMGTPDSRAPEQTRGMNVDHRADIYSLGVMLYEMLCRETPRGAFDLPSARTGCDPRLDAIVLKAMQQAPERRYQSTVEMKADVERARAPIETPPPVVEHVASAPPRAVEKVAALAPKKNRPPLWIAFAVVLVSVLSVSGFFAKHRPKSTAKITADAAVPAAGADGKWVDGLAEWFAKRAGGADIMTKVPEGARVNEFKAAYFGGQERDVAVRITARVISQELVIFIRSKTVEGGFNRYWVSIAPDGNSRILKGLPSSESVLAQCPAPPGYSARDRHTIQFRAVGDLLTLTVDGRPIGTARDGDITNGGLYFVAGVGSIIEKLEYLDLGGTAPPTPKNTEGETPAAATKAEPFVNSLGMKFVPVPGTQVLFSVWETRVQDYAVFARATKANAAWTMQEKDGMPISRGPRDPACAVNWDEANAFCRWLTEKERAEGKLAPSITYRLPTDEEWSRAAGMEKEDGATPTERNGKNHANFPWGTGFPPKDKTGNFADASWHEKFPNEDWIASYSDGYVTTSPVGSFAANGFGIYDLAGNIGEWCEDLLEPGNSRRVYRGGAWKSAHADSFWVSTRSHDAPEGRGSHLGFRVVLTISEVAPAKSASATPATAAKEAPFVNTLGMKFVPVPGTQALFSVWDTRVQDYEWFGRGRNVDDAWTKQEKDGVPVSRGADYPVVGVSWDDARAFCVWLTEKERVEGKLPQGIKYRLPTDEEWSRAVGLAKEEGATPKERDGKNTLDFPWGTVFPPATARMGNYADAAWHEKFPKEAWMEGYVDGYATTSPVGSFAPNAYGLYDMGGNVWQWCEDRFEPGGADRARRGASWSFSHRDYLLSSCRHHYDPYSHISDIGFRCVLAPVAAPPPGEK